MTIIKVEQISPDAPDYRAVLPSCHGCRGCGTGHRVVRLPQAGRRLARIEMSGPDQWRVLLNSWLKPLLILVGASAVCSMFSPAPQLEVSLLVFAFMLGVWFCREVPAMALSCMEEDS